MPACRSIPTNSTSSPTSPSRSASASQPGQDLYMTAPTSALPLARRIAAAGLQGRRRARDDDLLRRGDDARRAIAYGQDASFDRAAGWLYEGVAKAFDEQYRAPRHRRRQPDAAGRAGPRQGRPRQPRACPRPTSRRQNKIVNFDINWTIVPYPGHVVGQGRCSRTTPRTSRSASSPTRSSPRPASRRPIRSPPGPSTMRQLRSARTG